MKFNLTMKTGCQRPQLLHKVTAKALDSNQLMTGANACVSKALSIQGALYKLIRNLQAGMDST